MFEVDYPFQVSVTTHLHIFGGLGNPNFFHKKHLPRYWDLVSLAIFLRISTMGFITIFHRHLRGNMWVSFFATNKHAQIQDDVGLSASKLVVGDFFTGNPTILSKSGQ